MSFGEIAQSIADQFVTVWNAPVPFLAALLLVGFGLWKFIQHAFTVRLANAESTNDMLRERLSHAETNETMAIATTGQVIAAKAELDPVAITAELPQPARARVSKAAPPAKEYVPEDFNLESIFEPLRNKTGLQARNEIIPNVGKWLRVNGSVRAANPLGKDGGLIGLHIENVSRLTFCVFRPVPEEVSALSINDVVEIEGRINRLTGNSLLLEDCVLLSTKKPAQPS